VLAAVGSFLDARHHGGRWQIRIEDLDTARVLPGSATQILRTLESLNLFWDGEVSYQSGRLALYEAALRRLRDSGQTFECSCSRQMRGAQGEAAYPGTCRDGPRAAGPTATRFRINDRENLEFTDRIQGLRHYRLGELGDVIIRRRDGQIAYQLAVVVDDAEQNITDVVRGADLLDSTAWQIKLQRALGYSTPRHAHLPVVTAADGGKLAKSRCSLAPDLADPAQVLIQALVLLQQRPPAELAGLEPREVLIWAISNWNPALMHGLSAVPALPATVAPRV
jgi:glutamyl-Q tRNA(Asp) synthetase